MGDAILQKTFCTDFLTKKMKKNEGELPQYHIKNSHPAIVSAEVFELVQMEIESRRQFGSRYSGRGVFASRIVCTDCGGFYGSKVWHSNDPYRTVIWRCNRKYEKGKNCTTPHVKEDDVKAGFVQVMARLLASKQEVYGLNQVFLGTIKGLGDTTWPMICTLVCYSLFRVLWCHILIPIYPSMRVVYSSYVVSFFLMLGMLVPAYKGRMRRPSGAVMS